MSALSFAAAARLAVRRGDRPAAERQLGRAMRARPLCTFVLPHVAVRVRLQLGTVYVTLAEQPTARHLLAEIDDILAHRPDLGGLVDEVSALRARVSAQGAEAGQGRRSPPPSCACCRTCRRSSPSASGCSCPATPSPPKLARSIASAGVSSRSAAVERATTVGLLGG